MATINHQKLLSKNIVISAAADGIGWSIAEHCMTKGYNVFLTDINEDKLSLLESHKNYNILNHSAIDVKNNKLDKYFAESDFKSINVKLGQALIFSSYLVHKSGSNNSNQIRMSFNVRFNDLLNKEYIKRGLSFDKLPDTKIKNL